MMRIEHQPRARARMFVCLANDAMNSRRVYIAIFITRPYYRLYS